MSSKYKHLQKPLPRIPTKSESTITCHVSSEGSHNGVRIILCQQFGGEGIHRYAARGLDKQFRPKDSKLEHAENRIRVLAATLDMILACGSHKRLRYLGAA